MSQGIMTVLLIADLALKLFLAALFIRSQRKKSQQEQAEKEAELFLSQVRGVRAAQARKQESRRNG